jgi:hypothetical protein
MRQTKERIEEIKNHGYQLDFGEVFNHAFENYKKIALYAGLVLFVFSVILGVLAFGILTSIFGIAALDKTFFESVKLENLSGIFIVVYLIIGVLVTAILSPFTAGFLKMADCGENDTEFNVSTFFEYYKAPYFKEIFTATLLIGLVSSGLSTLIELASIELVGMLISIAISFLTFLTIPLIVFGNLKAIEAIQTSFSIVTKQIWILILLLFVSFIASMVGFIGCCIGIFFTIPFMYSMHYAIYCAIVGIETENEIEEIGSDID